MGDTVIPTEDVVHALLDYLVEPLLHTRARISSDRSPTPSQHEAMAKQMHAVVLLYNYYHRKQFQHLEFLDFESFCKVSVNAKPRLLVYLRLMQRCSSETNELEKLLSATEKAIMNACNISLALDASRDIPCMEEWPISKVVVFLVDEKKKNCLLLFSSITQGVWSPLEKDIDNSDVKLGDRSKLRKTNTYKSATGNFDQLAYSTVQEKTGIDQTDLMILESHIVPSLSAEKAAACFYLLHATKTLDKNVIPIPIEETIDSLQGPLVKSLGRLGNVTSAVVENFHLLPYARILSDWLSRVGQENETMESSPTMDHSDIIVDESSDRPCLTGNTTTVNQEVNLDCLTRGMSEDDSPVVHHSPKGKIMPTQNIVSVNPVDCSTECTTVNQEVNLECLTRGMSEDDSSAVHHSAKVKIMPTQNIVSVNPVDCSTKFTTANQEVNLDCFKRGMSEDDSSVVQHSTKGESMSTQNIVSLNHVDCSTECKQKVEKVDKVDLVIEPCNNGHSGAKVAYGKDNDNIGEPCDNGCSGAKSALGKDNDNIALLVKEGIPSADHPVISSSHSENPEKIFAILSSKRSALLNAAVRALHTKRVELSQQQRYVQDEFALCEQNLQKVLSGGNDLMLKLECIIEACNTESYTSTPSHVDIHQNSEEQSTTPMKMNKLSEAVLCLRNPCQDLDEICCKNNWALPRYNVLPSNGGIHAKVTLNGMDFEFSVGGEPHANPREARESAAANMLAKLRSTANQSKLTHSKLFR